MSVFDNMKVAADLAEQVYWKNLAYGRTGSGKTYFTARFARPLIALTEPQGLNSIQEANDFAVPVQSKGGKVGIFTVGGIEAFKRMLRDPALVDHFDAVGVDSLTDIQRIYKKYYTERYLKNVEAGAKENKFWVFGQVLEQMMSFCREIRNAPVHSSVICLERHDKDDQGKILRTYPDLEGGIRDSVGQFFNSVGYMSRRKRENGIRYEINFNAGPKYETKRMSVFDDVECPEPLYLLQKRFGGDIPEDVRLRVDEWKQLDEIKENND